MSSSAEIAKTIDATHVSTLESLAAPAQSGTSRSFSLQALIICLIAIVLLLDIYAPDGVAGAIPYVLPVWIAAVSGQSLVLRYTVGLCVILVLGSLAWLPDSTVAGNWYIYVNRALAILAIVTTAGVRAWSYDRGKSPTVAFPHITYVSPLISLLILLAISWSMHSVFTDVGVLSRKERDIIRISGEIAFYDEALTSSAVMVAVTGETEWIDRYSEHELQLAERLEQLMLDESGSNLTIELARKSNDRLILMERTAFGLATDGQLEPAFKILMGQEYQKQKRQFAENLAISSDRLLSFIAREKRALIEKFWAVLALALLAGLACLPIWAMALKALSRWKVAEESYRQEISRAAGILQERNRELEEFNYIASHDLRAPLRAIENLAGWVREDAFDSLNAESRGHVEKIQQRVRSMRKLLDDLLSYSRAGYVTGEVETVDCRSLVGEAIAMFEFPDDVSVSIDGECAPLETYISPLKICLRHLVENALKHNDKDDRRVDIFCREAGDMVEISVRDNGPGIPVRNQARIFQIFQTLEKTDEKGASGVGLALARKTAIAHGGNLTVESAEGEGATFTLCWPKVVRKSPGSSVNEVPAGYIGEVHV